MPGDLPTPEAEEAYLSEVRAGSHTHSHSLMRWLNARLPRRACVQVRARMDARGAGYTDDGDALFMSTYIHRTLHEVSALLFVTVVAGWWCAYEFVECVVFAHACTHICKCGCACVTRPRWPSGCGGRDAAGRAAG